MRLFVRIHEALADRLTWVQYPAPTSSVRSRRRDAMPMHRRVLYALFAVLAILAGAIAGGFGLLVLWSALSVALR
jgi:nitrate reductase NapE component